MCQTHKWSSDSQYNTESACLDIKASSFWSGRFQSTIFYASTLMPLRPLPSTRMWKAPRVWREGSWGWTCKFQSSCILHRGLEAWVLAYKHLAYLLSLEWNTPYSRVMSWLSCCLSFFLLHSTIMCIRSSHSFSGWALRVSQWIICCNLIDAACIEAATQVWYGRGNQTLALCQGSGYARLSWITPTTVR